MRILFAILSAILLTASAGAQSKFIGIWEGKLKAAGQEIRLVFHISQGNGRLLCKMDSPDQGAAGTPASNVITTEDSIYIELASIGIEYAGRLWDKETISGKFMQSGYTFPMDIMKTENPTQLNRPQTPKPPFNYKSEEVSYFNTVKSVSFAGTLTIPNGTGPFPAILLVSGSGSQNRDEEIFGHKPFAVLADYLTKQGYVVLRVDDRGAGKTVGEAMNVTTADLTKDAYAGLNFLATRKEVNSKKMGIYGHSEGGLIATMLAAERKDIDFIVSVAGPGIEIIQLMEEQTANVLKSNGADSAFVSNYRTLYRGIIKAINAAKDSNQARSNILASINDWKKTVSDQVQLEMGVIEPRSLEQYVQAYIDIYNNKWYNYFLHINPQPYIEKLSCKVLVINGEKDIQVVSSSNLAGWKEALAKSKSKVYNVIELAGMNHLLQTCTTCIVSEYSLLPETISVDALKAISDWLNKNVK